MTPAAGLALAGGLLLAAAGCGPEAPDGKAGAGPASAETEGGETWQEQAVVVVSVPPLAWFVERLAGDRARVAVMVPPGARPGVYEPTARQMRTVERADLYVAVGHPRFPFEAAWLDALVAASPGMRVVRAGAGCRTLPADPHVWLSTQCARTIADAVARALAGVLREGSGDLGGRVERVTTAVDSVEARVAAALRPHRGRSFLVLHPALGYLAREYGLRQLAVERGVAGPGPGELAQIVRTASREGIRTVFAQPQFSQAAARTVARQLPGGRVVTIDPLARDWPGALVGIARELAASFEGAPAPGAGPTAAGNRSARAPAPAGPR